MHFLVEMEHVLIVLKICLNNLNELLPAVLRVLYIFNLIDSNFDISSTLVWSQVTMGRMHLPIFFPLKILVIRVILGCK